MNASQPVRSRTSWDDASATPGSSADASASPQGEPPTAPPWRTQERISRCRGLDHCVIEVHEFDVERPLQRPPTLEYRVYAVVHGFPVGEALASFASLAAAQRYAEALSARDRSDADAEQGSASGTRSRS